MTTKCQCQWASLLHCAVAAQALQAGRGHWHYWTEAKFNSTGRIEFRVSYGLGGVL